MQSSIKSSKNIHLPVNIVVVSKKFLLSDNKLLVTYFKKIQLSIESSKNIHLSINSAKKDITFKKKNIHLCVILLCGN